jgi:hypothetical protein
MVERIARRSTAFVPAQRAGKPGPAGGPRPRCAGRTPRQHRRRIRRRALHLERERRLRRAAGSRPRFREVSQPAAFLSMVAAFGTGWLRMPREWHTRTFRSGRYPAFVFLEMDPGTWTSMLIRRSPKSGSSRAPFTILSGACGVCPGGYASRQRPAGRQRRRGSKRPGRAVRCSGEQHEAATPMRP